MHTVLKLVFYMDTILLCQKLLKSADQSLPHKSILLTSSSSCCCS